MPGPMPPPGAPPPQGAPDAPPSAPPQGQDGGGISKLLMNVDQAIDHLQMVITQSKATSPEEKQMISQVDQVYGKLMDSLGASGPGQDADDQGAPGGQGQTVPPEAGGNKGAVPAM